MLLHLQHKQARVRLWKRLRNSAKTCQWPQKEWHMYLLENEQEEIRSTVLKSGAGGMEYITDIFWRAITNDVAGRDLEY